jgi:tetratricopeptide (TPR) repeat protein
VTAVRQLSKGLIKFPKFVEGYVTRAKLYVQQQNWDKAIADCYKAITLNPSDPTGFIGLGDALKGIGDVKSALQSYTKAISCGDTTETALSKRVGLYIELEEYRLALQDIELIL